VLEGLEGDEDWLVRKEVARKLNAPMPVRAAQTEDGGTLKRSGIAKNPINAEADVEGLAASDNLWDRIMVASDPCAPEAVLKRLAKDAESLVRNSIAANPNTPVAVLEELAGDEPSVRHSIAGNPNTPVAVLKELVGDSDESVRTKAARNAGSAVLFDQIMKGKAIKAGVFESFLSNPRIVTVLDPYLPDFLRLLQGKAPLFES